MKEFTHGAKGTQERISRAIEPQTTYCTFLSRGALHIFSIDTKCFIYYRLANGNWFEGSLAGPGVNFSNHAGFLTCKVLK